MLVPFRTRVMAWRRPRPEPDPVGPGQESVWDYPRPPAMRRCTLPIEVVLGLPRNLAGVEGPAALAIRQVAAELVAKVGALPVRLVDERLTTVTASRQLSGTGRNTRKQRAVIDQAAAVALLEQALQYERTTGLPLGGIVEPREETRKDSSA